jgi:hypothetical protein
MSGSASAAAPDPRRPTAGDAGEGLTDASVEAASSTDAGDRPPPAGDEPSLGDERPPIAERPGSPASPGATLDDEREAAPTLRSPAAGATHGDFLVTSDERDRAEAQLRQAVADEVLSLEEFGDRMRLLLTARTRAELHRAVAGLAGDREPVPRTADRGQVRPAREQGSVVAILGNADARGRWRPAHSTTVVAALGEAKVDLQGAEYADDELVINAFSALGSVEIIVPEGVDVDLRGIAVLGERSDKTDGTVLPGAPVVRVEGLAVLGNIIVRHPKAKERYRAADDRGAFADRVPLQSTAPDRRARTRPTPGGASVRRWISGLLAAAVIAVPLGWVLSSDDVAGALFGSTQQAVAVEQLAAGEETTVGVPMAFGSVTLEVPDDVNVERDGLIVFGSCEGCGARASADAPTVRIRTVGAFGSVEVVRVPSAR